MHGDLGQGQRERALRAFRSGKVDVLTATEVAARGLDVDDVTHVVNYECPDDEKTYVHRIGRTGRAGRPGVAVTFVDWRDMHRWKLINDALGLGQPEPEETYSTSEHLYTELDIPREATGTLPRARCAAGPAWRPRRWRTSARPAGSGSPRAGSAEQGAGRPARTPAARRRRRTRAGPRPRRRGPAGTADGGRPPALGASGSRRRRAAPRSWFKVAR